MISSCLLGIMHGDWTGKVRYVPERTTGVFSCQGSADKDVSILGKTSRDHYKSGRTFSYAKSVVKLLHFMTHGQFFL